MHRLLPVIGLLILFPLLNRCAVINFLTGKQVVFQDVFALLQGLRKNGITQEKTLRPGDLVPPMRRSGCMVVPEQQALTELVEAARLDIIYEQRRMCETVFSVLKRKFGGTVRPCTYRHQQREPAGNQL